MLLNQSLVGEIHCLCMLACLVHIPLNETHLLFIQVTFIFFICNAMWLVATFILQAIGSSVTIRIPKSNLNLTQTREYLFIDPIGLMFLLGFASLLLIQFFAMFYHRWLFQLFMYLFIYRQDHQILNHIFKILFS